jgi:aminopeptidase N
MRKILIYIFTLSALSGKAQSPSIDVQHYSFAIQLTDASDTIKGQAIVQVKFLTNADKLQLNLVKTKSDGKGMLVSSVFEGDKNISFTQDSDVLNISSKIKNNSINNYTINYSGIPADGLIISTNKYGHRTFFGDNWPNRAHNWLPCADLPGDKAPVDFIVTAPDHYGVVANGLKVEEKPLPNHLKLTHWQETAELPTKVMVIGVADFAVDSLGKVNDIPVYTYVFPEDKEVGFKSYAVAKEILPFYIKKVGQYAYKKLANVQSKTIFGGMENAGAIFYFENSPNSPGIEELMAHEIAHQWFGDAASEKSFAHLWLSEGFATFMTNVYLESKYSTDTLKKRLASDRKTVLKFEKRRLTPVVDTAVKTNYMQLLNANSYQKGGWILQMLRHKLGDEAFWKGIRNYYARYDGANANTNDLCMVMEKASGQNLKSFFNQWLYTAGHPELGVNWKYNATKKLVELKITQTQATLYDVSLDVAVNGVLHTINIKNKETTIAFPAKVKPDVLIVDPAVNLLASFEVTEIN